MIMMYQCYEYMDFGGGGFLDFRFGFMVEFGDQVSIGLIGFVVLIFL